jgi:hypothetical protein
MIGIKDINGIDIEVGHNVEVRVKSWNGDITICKGKIEYRDADLSSWGCGYAVMDANAMTFLSSISRSSTEIEIIS